MSLPIAYKTTAYRSFFEQEMRFFGAAWPSMADCPIALNVVLLNARKTPGLRII
jgi:hypothetical protein